MPRKTVPRGKPPWVERQLVPFEAGDGKTLHFDRLMLRSEAPWGPMDYVQVSRAAWPPRRISGDVFETCAQDEVKVRILVTPYDEAGRKVPPSPTNFTLTRDQLVAILAWMDDPAPERELDS